MKTETDTAAETETALKRAPSWVLGSGLGSGSGSGLWAMGYGLWNRGPHAAVRTSPPPPPLAPAAEPLTRCPGDDDDNDDDDGDIRATAPPLLL